MAEKLKVTNIEVKNKTDKKGKDLITEEMRKRFFDIQNAEKSTVTTKSPQKCQEGDPKIDCLII